MQIQDLAKALRAGSQGEAALAGYDEDYMAAKARGQNTSQADKYGQLSGLSVLSDVMKQSQSRKDLRELRPKREAARQAIAGNANAQGLYNARVNAAKVDRDEMTSDRDYKLRKAMGDLRQNQYDRRNTEKDAALKLAAAKKNLKTVYDVKDPTNKKDVYIGADGTPIDTETGQPFSMEGWTTAPPPTGRAARAITRQGTDAKGNTIINTYAPSGKLISSAYMDGSPVSQEEVIRQGQSSADQAGAEAWAKETAKANMKGADLALTKLGELEKLEYEMKKGLAALDEGAMTGPFASRVMSVRESTLKLENAIDRMSLMDIGNYTFGSLSSSEADWLKHANLPDNISEEALRPWLENRIKATQSLMAATEYIYDMRAENKPVNRKMVSYLMRVGDATYGEL